VPAPSPARHENAVAALARHLRGLRPDPGRAEAAAREVGAQALQASTAMDSPQFEQIAADDLWGLFRGYDAHFFSGLLAGALAPCPWERLRLRLSPRMTSAGGKALHYRGSTPTRFEIAISSHLLFTNFAPGEVPVTVNGLTCPTRLAALQRIFEHELVHLVELLLWARSSCRQPRFRALAHALFGHTDVTHRLATPRQQAWRAHRVQTGARVWFHFGGRRLEGFVNRISKRATVLVPDPAGLRYSDGGHYAKYYVPVAALRRR
jgi:hypothetical protein